MSALALDGGAFEPPLRPPWLRPLAVGVVIVLHAAALSLVYLEPKPVASPGEVVVEIEAQPAAEATPPADEASPEQAAPPPAEQAAPAPAEPLSEPAPPVAQAAPPEEQPPLPPPQAAPPQTTPPAAETPPPEAQPEPPPAAAPLELAPPPPPKTVEAPPPKPAPPPRVEAAKPRPRSEQRPAPSRRPAETRAEPRSAPARNVHGALSAGAPPSAAPSAASLSAYRGEVSAIIRGRLFYPEAARARGARGMVGVAFTIGRSGAVTSFAITRSSGDRDLDAAARALVQGARFPPPPGGAMHIATSFNYAPR